MTRRWLIPEVVQTSGMDCGPASLVAFLGGFGISVSYGRLREACQTDVDGTSIDVLEQMAVALGLDAQQTLVPVDHVLRPEADALPCIAVVRLPNGVTHFEVPWRLHGPYVQVMDPATGRRFVHEAELEAELYVHEMDVPAAAWRDYAASPEFQRPLAARLRELGATAADAQRLIRAAEAEPGWLRLAALDAATRLVASLGGSVGKAHRASLVEALAARAVADASVIPEPLWSARATPPGEDGEEQVRMRGAVMVRAAGLRKDASADELPRDLRAALDEGEPSPWAALVRMLREEGALAPAAVALALGGAAAALTVEALVLRGLLDGSRSLVAGWQRAGAVAALLVVLVASLALDLGARQALARLGRGLETRLRVAFSSKLPRLGDRYFASRLVSDMAERAHALHRVRELPDLAGTAVRSVASLVLTTLGLGLVDPWLLPLAAVAAVAAVAIPALASPSLTERDLRTRSHLGALSRFTWDALRGLVAVRTHGAEVAMAREQESLLVAWAQAAARAVQAGVAFEALQGAVGYAFAAALLAAHLARADHAGSALLVAWWALALPATGQQLVRVARELPTIRSVTLRALEPLGAPEETEPAGAAAVAEGTGAVAIRFEAVTVVAGGHVVLRDVGLEVGPGEHVAVVGASGSGKSTLVGALLGLHRPAAGRLLVDGDVVEGAALARLRAATAWLDPAVQLWNRSLLENLRYGRDGEPGVGRVLAAADLVTVLEALPDGLQTALGEGGGLVSGGEGQRVRLARAMLRDGVGLALLDEPFRGLDRVKRATLLERAREAWVGATLLCVTHDISAALTFPRVVVLDGGQIVEDGDPADLARGDGALAALLRAEEQVRTESWGEGWRRIALAGGRVAEEAP